jgi:hypothetical protein
MSTEQEIRHQLTKIESRLAWLAAELCRVEGQHDSLLSQLTDLEGAHDRRPVAVR